MLKALLAIAQNIFAHIAQVNIQVTSFECRICIGQEWVHQPKFDILNIRFLKIGIIQFAHDTTPTLLWISQLAIKSNLVCGNIIRTTLLWVETQVHHRQFRICIRQRLLVWVNLLLHDHTRTMIRHGLGIILNVLWCVALRNTKDWIYSVPCQ